MPINLTLDGPVSLDLEDVGELPQEGWHTATVERAEARESSNGNTQIGTMWRITDDTDPDVGMTFWTNLTFKEGFSMTVVKRCLKALGFPDRLEYETLQALAEDMVGREAEVQVSHREYQGEKQVNVTKWRESSLDIEL